MSGVPHGSPIAMPKTAAVEAAAPVPTFGTATFLGKTSAWQSNTVAKPAAADQVDDILIYIHGNDDAGYKYCSGASQDGSIVTSQIVAGHNGNAWQSTYIDLLRLLPTKSWPANFNHNHQKTTWDANIMAAFRPGPGFEGIPARAHRSNPGYVSSFSYPIPTNLMVEPGGIAIVACTIDTGGAGPSATVTGSGWVSLGTGGTNVAAYYILDTESVETPPNPGFSCSRSDQWCNAMVYIR